MIRILFLAFALSFIWNCAGLMPREDRRSEKVFESKLTKKQIYERAMVYLAKTLTSANNSIQIRDESAGRIVAHGSIECKKYRTLYAMNRILANFNLDLTVKDYKYRLIFDDIELSTFNGQGQEYKIGEPNDKEQLELIDAGCLEALKSHLVEAIEGKSITTGSEF